MSDRSARRVVWSEGLFLRPAHLQQLERSIEYRIEARARGALAPGWGLSHLRLDSSALEAGRIALQGARGVLPDGTPFSLPDDAPAPPPLVLGADDRDVTVSLVLAPLRAGVPEFSFDPAQADARVRYIARDHVVEDVVPGCSSPATEMALGELVLRLERDDRPTEGACRLPVARVVERRATGALVLDETWIPPVLDCRAVPALRAVLAECHHLLQHRAEALAARLPAAAAHGGGAVRELLRLQATNRHEAALAHLASRDLVHPEPFYAALRQAVAEFATFDERRGHRARDLPPYRHDDLRGCLQPLLMVLRELLSEIAHPGAVPIALQSRAPGLWSAVIAEPALAHAGRFILVARADVPEDAWRRQFPAQAKIGPPDRIRDLVTLHLPAIPLEALPAAPPALPFYAGHTYFELARGTPLWPQIETARALALHVAGDFPGLQVELWALRP